MLAQGRSGLLIADGAAVAVAALNLVPGAGPQFFLEFTGADGTHRREPLTACVTERFESALPEKLKELQHQVSVTASDARLGPVTVQAAPSLAVNHKNKYGQDYEKQPATPYP